MSLALSICVLFISLMQSVNEFLKIKQFLKTTSLLLLFGLRPICSEIDIVHLTSIYASL